MKKKKNIDFVRSSCHVERSERKSIDRAAQRSHSTLSPTAIPSGIHPIPSELGSQACEGPASTVVGDRAGKPSGAVGFLLQKKNFLHAKIRKI